VPAERARATARRLRSKGRAATTSRTSPPTFPLGTFTCVTGVSGGGKSTLTIETLFKTAAMR
jgi:excinuclease ABC subunit A